MKEFYKKNGYLIVPILTPAECDVYLDIFNEYADADFSAILNLDRKDIVIASLIEYESIIAIIEKLQKAPVVALMSQMLFKKAHSPYASQAWNPHQDNAYPQAEKGAYITVNIFLKDADPKNGGMYVYPGSHEEELLPFEPTVSYREKGTNPGNRVQVPEKYEKQDIIAKKGDMLVLHGHLIHGSYANQSDRDRPLYSISYITQGKSFIRGKNADRKIIPVH